jgi:DNA-binding transcriptional ArsR family regulator
MYSGHIYMVSPDLVFKAISHPARRKIITLLSESNCSVKQLTAAFAISQPAVSQHLRDLKEAHLVMSEKMGMEQIYRLTAEPLRTVFEWSSQYRRFFDPAGHAWSFVPANHPEARQTNRGRKRHGR